MPDPGLAESLPGQDSPALAREYTPDQVRLCLAMLAHAGTTGPAARDTERLHATLESWLERLEPLSGQSIVWGPVSFRLRWQPSAPALVAFVVAEPQTEGYCVVVRGGTPLSPLDQLDSFSCLEQEPWVWGRDIEGSAPAICAGIDGALGVLRRATPDERVPGSGRTLAEFLSERLHEQEVDRRVPIHLTGHGLGATLAGVLALWLLDNQGQAPTREEAWDPQRRAKIRCTAFGGPSAGNPDFAGYIADRFGGDLTLIHNTLDHVPALWDPQTLCEVPELYRPHVQDAALVRALVMSIAAEIERNGIEYEQPPAIELEGRLATELPPTFLAQAAHQHLHAYVDLLALRGILDIDAIMDRPSGVDGGPVAQ